VSGLVIQNGQPYLCNDALHDPNFVHKEILQGISAFACAPLNTHNATLGILWIGRTTSIIASEVRVLVAIADIAANAMQRAALHEQTTQQLRRLTALRTIDSGISNSFDMRVTLNIFIEQVMMQLNVHAASILISKDTLSLEYAAGSGFRNRGIAKSRLRVGESHAGRAALERRMVAVPDLGKDPFTASDILPAEGFVSYYGVPLIAKGQLKGVLQIFHRAPFSPDEEWLDFLQTLAGQAAIAIDNAAMFDNLQRANSELLVAYNATIEGWSRALDLRDQETEGHTLRVTEMALNLATAMGVEDTQLIHLQRGALLHDIGKMGVPDSILLKPGTLTDPEMEIMRRHPQYAYDMLSPIPFLRPALDIPYCHHEKWDGTGYPRKLKGEQIPLVARIFAVVDVWDAITSDRPYRAAWSHDKARDYIREQSGLYFEPRIVDMFLKMIETLQ
jgi:putative nucleotidyltransferase with HDIG domain